MKDELIALALRCEGATPDQTHDLLIEAFEAVKGPRRTTPRPGIVRWHDDWFRFEKLIGAGGFIDAAMSLVEPTWHCGMGRDGNLHNPTRSWAWVRYYSDGQWRETENVWANGEPCLALCAAALRARASLS